MAVRKLPVVAGSVFGTAAVAWYLWRNYGASAGAQIASPPDPLWTVLVNIILILFVSIFTAVRLSRLVARASRYLNRKSGQ